MDVVDDLDGVGAGLLKEREDDGVVAFGVVAFGVESDRDELLGVDAFGVEKDRLLDPKLLERGAENPREPAKTGDTRVVSMKRTVTARASRRRTLAQGCMKPLPSADLSQRRHSVNRTGFPAGFG